MLLTRPRTGGETFSVTLNRGIGIAKTYETPKTKNQIERTKLLFTLLQLIGRC